ncbi:MAG TPA: DUF4962 domain-containing protein [Aggregatilineaceae bacterium]|nr:DUF4962 domain-containing protein [Aggregatilineaceae bacterium]
MELQNQASTTHESIWKPIQALADNRLDYVPQEITPVDESLDFFRNSGNVLMVLAFTCVITEQADYCDAAKRNLLTYMAWDQWDKSNARDLGLAHMLMGASLAYDWLYTRLTSEEQDIVRRSLATWAQRMYEASTLTNSFGWQNWWHKSYMQNHYWVNNSALGMTGLALLSDGPLAPQCVTPAGNTAVNIRAWQGSEYQIAGTLAVGETAQVIALFDGVDGYGWWHLADGGWIRSDVVHQTEACEASTLDPQLWIDQAQDRLAIGQIFLENIGDGSWHEGMNYQNYLLTMSLPFLINLRTLTGADILPHTYLRNYTYWRLYNYLPGTADPLLSYGNLEEDWGNSRASHSVLQFIANEYDDGYAAWTAEQIATTSGRDSNVFTAPWYVFEFFYYNPTVVPIAPTELPGTRQFPDLTAVIWRTGWEANDLVFGLKTGAYGGRYAFDTFTAQSDPWETPCSDTLCQLNVGHNHDDMNGFYLYQGGWLAPESVGYNLSATSFHNTLLIDGEGQYRPSADNSWRDPEAFAGSDGFLEATADSPNFNYLAADATRRYKTTDQLNDVTRYVVFIRPGYFVMIDHINADAPHQADWLAHFGTSVTIEDNWIRGESKNGQLLGISFASPLDFEVEISTDNYPYVSVHPVSPSEDVLFASVLYPTDSSGWDAKPTLTLVEETDEAVLLHLQLNDSSEQAIDILITTSDSEAPVKIGSLQFDGDVAVLVKGADGVLQKLFVYGGTSLVDNGETLIDGLNTEATFEAVYTNGTVDVSSNFQGAIRLYAPGVQKLTVNGESRSFSESGHFIGF